MTVSKSVRLLSLVLLTGIFVSVPAFAEIETTTSNLKDCINAHLASERQKNSPNVESLLGACNAEYQALVADLPQGAREEIRREINDQIREKLNE